ncbi:MAG: hypothetical protein PHF86_14105 [Candidatus Nanoarchaeia archaeon]|jgi:hypothetical protein|nr:hypothetical protein [Candidatus Nanoarchaeia archaeon]
MRNKENIIFIVFGICLIIITISLLNLSVSLSYGRLELREFNKLNNTNYTIRQWRIYEYDIKKLYPFIGQR